MEIGVLRYKKNSELSLFKKYLLNRKQFVQMGEISATTQTIKLVYPKAPY